MCLLCARVAVCGHWGSHELSLLVKSVIGRDVEVEMKYTTMLSALIVPSSGLLQVAVGSHRWLVSLCALTQLWVNPHHYAILERLGKKKDYILFLNKYRIRVNLSY